MGCHSTKTLQRVIPSIGVPAKSGSQPLQNQCLQASTHANHSEAQRDLVHGVHFETPHLRSGIHTKKASEAESRSERIVSPTNPRDAADCEYHADNEQSPALSFKILRSKLSIRQSQLDEFRNCMGSKRDLLDSSRRIQDPLFSDKVPKNELLSHARFSSDGNMEVYLGRLVSNRSLVIDRQPVASASQTSHGLACRKKEAISSRELQTNLRMRASQPQIQGFLPIQKTQSKFRTRSNHYDTQQSQGRLISKDCQGRCVQNAAPAVSLSMGGTSPPNIVVCKQTARTHLRSTESQTRQLSLGRRGFRLASSKEPLLLSKSNFPIAGDDVDGPSWFRRSNSAIQRQHQRAATSALPLDLLLEEVVQQSDQNNSAKSHMLPVITSQNGESVLSQGSLVQESKLMRVSQPTRSLQKGDSVLQPNSEEWMGNFEIASKREIKQINVLKGKSSVFNYTIKARETQLIKPQAVKASLDSPPFRKNLLQGNTSRSISKPTYAMHKEETPEQIVRQLSSAKQLSKQFSSLS